MKKLGLATIALSALLLSGCGGGGSKKSKSITEQISEKNYIVIAHNFPNGICESIPYKQKLQQDGFTNFITNEKDNTASCALYGKSVYFCESVLYTGELYTENGYLPEGNVACVVGFDNHPSLNNKSFKKIDSLELSDTLMNAYLEMI